MGKIRNAIAISAVILGAAAAVACGGASTPKPTTPTTQATAVTAHPSTTKAPTKATGDAHTLPPAKISAEQANANRAAGRYLGSQSFSRKGLIKQLEFEGYPSKAATAAVDGLHADWNAEAVSMAKTYLEGQAFSRKSLIVQLEFEGFTRAQATHGATGAGL